MNTTTEIPSDSRDVEQPCSAAEFAGVLRQIAARIEQGEPLEVEIDGETIVVPDHAEFSFEHERDEEGECIEFQMSWTRPGTASDEDPDDCTGTEEEDPQNAAR